MPDTTPDYQRFFAELKRRHVFRVMAVYGVVGFVLLQLVDLVVPALLLPDWTYRFFALLLLVGFPIALVVTWAFEITPDGVGRTSPAAPGELEVIVAQPAARRWTSGILALVGAAALLAGGWWIGRRSTGGAEVEPAAAEASLAEMRLAVASAARDDRASIAVLPFADMSPDGDQEYFSDGITEELLNVLTRIRELRVIARTSVFAFKGQNLTAEQLGDTLRVQYLLEGSVRKADDALRITAQLIDAADGSHLWSEQYDRELEDVFVIQSEIAAAIAGELSVSLGIDRSDLVTPTADLEAYDLYLAGRAKTRERGASLREAIRLFNAAILRDSAWAPAWAGLAEAYEVGSFYPAAWQEQPTQAPARHEVVTQYQTAAESAAKRALSLDPDIASARTALGSVYRNRRQWDAAEREYLRALQLDPDNAEAHQQYAEMLHSMGRVSEGLAAAERSVRLDPAPIRQLILSLALWADGRREAALEAIDAGIARDPGDNVPYLEDVGYLLQLSLGRYDEAREALPSGQGFVRVTPAQHEQLVGALRTSDPSRFPGAFDEQPFLLIATWAPMGDTARALLGAEQLLAQYPHENLAWLWYPELDPVRAAPRFQAVLERINLRGVRPERTAQD